MSRLRVELSTPFRLQDSQAWIRQLEAELTEQGIVVESIDFLPESPPARPDPKPSQ